MQRLNQFVQLVERILRRRLKPTFFFPQIFPNPQLDSIGKKWVSFECSALFFAQMTTLVRQAAAGFFR